MDKFRRAVSVCRQEMGFLLFGQGLNEEGPEGTVLSLIDAMRKLQARMNQDRGD